MTEATQKKVRKLHELLSEFKRVGVAFSGGVDSSFLLRTAFDVLGTENVVLLHARSCLQKQDDQEGAASWLKRHGYNPAEIDQRIIDLQPLAWKEFVQNPPDRCYFCKQHLYRTFLDILKQDGSTVLVDGTNCDDLEQGQKGRPGLRAIAELGVQKPLADSGLRKAEIRELSRELRLETWEQPSASCLATRIPHGIKITAEKLERVDILEQAVAGLGFKSCRVRLNSESVHLQLLRDDLDRFCCPTARRKVRSLLKNMGVDKIFLDLDGR